MSNARFDTGETFQWTPAGLFQLDMAANAADTTFFSAGADVPSGAKYIRLDWASVVCELVGLDLDCGAKLMLTDFFGTKVPFLAAVATYQGEVTEEGLGVPYANPYGFAQTNSPMLIPLATSIQLGGAGTLLGGSRVSGTLSVSYLLGVPTSP